MSQNLIADWPRIVTAVFQTIDSESIQIPYYLIEYCIQIAQVLISDLQEKQMISLKPITEDNFIDAFHLKLASGQESFVSHPIRSLAQAYVYRNQCQPFGIYAEQTMVGYVMVIYDYDIPEYDIWHMMIDESMQGRGFGGEALERVIEYIRTKPFGISDRIALTCNKNNAIARRLYESRGFFATGVEDEDEIEMVLMPE